MIFASPIFLLLFLPLFLGAYYMTPEKWRSHVIVAGSSVFYAWWRIDFLFVLYGVILWSWYAARFIEKKCEKWTLWAGVLPCLLTLGYFKYWNFGVSSFQAMFLKAGTESPSPLLAETLLPVGISFFVFHAVSYIVDVWRKDAEATRSLVDYAAFITLFPHLVAGPVLRYKDLAPQFKNRVHSRALFSEGACRFMAGFAKKALVADAIAPLADAAFALEHPTMSDAWLGAVAYAVQLYFDFSGYSDMAVGLALMMGFRFIENFNLPYLARNITDFWRRWHISLATWLRDYVYIPLGGSREGRTNTYINLFLTMLLGGLWHGAGFTFIIWGAWHGALLVAERIRPFASRIYLLLAVLIGWVMFRAPDVGTAFGFYKAMIGLSGVMPGDDFIWQIRWSALITLAIGIALICLQPRFRKYGTPVPLSGQTMAMRIEWPPRLQIIVAVLFLLGVSRLLAFSATPFLYFQF